MHCLELCPVVRDAWDKKLGSSGLSESMIALWIKHGRQHPSILRQRAALREFPVEEEQSLERLLDWSWSVWVSADSGMPNVQDEPRR
jgi:hypothetical protein